MFQLALQTKTYVRTTMRIHMTMRNNLKSQLEHIECY